MIRPVTCVCLLLAAGSGLYLYQVKHRTRLLDRQIEQTEQAAVAVRERSGLLRAEWALLNDPSRLADLAARHLSLHQVTPAQFVTMADLDRRLPAIRSLPLTDSPPAESSPAPTPAPASVPIAQAAAPAAAASQPVRVGAADRPPDRTLDHHDQIARESPPRDAAPALRDASEREPLPAIKPVVSQAMATTAPRPAAPVPARLASYAERITATAASVAVARIGRGDVPRVVSALGAAAHAALAPPVPLATGSLPGTPSGIASTDPLR